MANQSVKRTFNQLPDVPQRAYAEISYNLLLAKYEGSFVIEKHLIEIIGNSTSMPYPSFLPIGSEFPSRRATNIWIETVIK